MTVEAPRAGDEVEISITDNGIGIPEAMRERVFDSFARAHGTAYGGTGLGLAICARVVNRHGGRIWVDDHDQPGHPGQLHPATGLSVPQAACGWCDTPLSVTVLTRGPRTVVPCE